MIKRYESVFKESPRVDDELLDLMMQFINENSANPNSDKAKFKSKVRIEISDNVSGIGSTQVNCECDSYTFNSENGLLYLYGSELEISFNLSKYKLFNQSFGGESVNFTNKKSFVKLFV